MSEFGTETSSFTSASSIGDARGPSAVVSALDETDSPDLDLISNNKTFRDTLFASIYLVTNTHVLATSAKFAALRVALEFLQLFMALFNRHMPWRIRQDTWIFKATQWLLFKRIVIPSGYTAYVGVMYSLTALLVVNTMCSFWLAFARKGEEPSHPWLNRLLTFGRLVAGVSCSILWPACLDYAISMLDCKWMDISSGGQAYHLHFPEHNCLAMPHLLHMTVAAFCAVVVAQCTLLLCLGTCDPNPMTRTILASTDAAAAVKTMFLKMLLVIAGGVLDDLASAQAIIILVAAFGIFYYQVVEVHYYSLTMNLVWSGLSMGLLSVASLLAVLHFSKRLEFSEQEGLTWAVLYLIVPASLLGAALAWLRMQKVKQLVHKVRQAFEEQDSFGAGRAASNTVVALHSKAGANTSSRAGTSSQKAAKTVLSVMMDFKMVHKWKDVRQVALVYRAMRVWDEDGVPDADALEFAEFVLKCGMARLPNNPSLRVMYANYLIEVRKDGQAARTQMQLAQKANPSVLESYSIFVVHQVAKQLKTSNEGLDLVGYVDFQRNFGVCVRAHKLALMAQRQFWNSMLRDTVDFGELEASLQLMARSEQRATDVYRRVLERYPDNGKILKVYGRFLEFVRNEPTIAAKFYAEALKHGTTESIMAMAAGKDGLTAVGNLNEKTDGLIIINASGTILMVNAAALRMFGYGKGELEGKNVSVLMPPPFSARHNSFLDRCVRSGQPRVLGKDRAMVALHKGRSVFPVTLCATHISGIGNDSMFMGVVRQNTPVCVEGNVAVRFWTTTAGMILCADSNTAGILGMDAASLVGQYFSSLCTDVEGVNRFLAVVAKPDEEDGDASFSAGSQVLRAKLLHNYLAPVEVELRTAAAGAVDSHSDCHTICVQACLLSESAATLVLDHKARVVYATDKLSAMLGYPLTSLLKMDLNALLPQPYCKMHGAWFKDHLNKKTCPTSCRAGGVVHLLAANGAKVPVTLKITEREDVNAGLTSHVVQVTKVAASMQLDQRRLLLGINHRGTILKVNKGTTNALFGFEPGELLGRPLAAAVDVFGLWRQKFGEDESLLAMLASQAISNAPIDGAGKAPASIDGKHGSAGASWRVGVHLPLNDDEAIAEHAAHLEAANRHAGMAVAGSLATDTASTFMHMMQLRNQMRPACLSMAVIEDEDQHNLDESNADSVAVLQVSLFRADALTSVIELDKRLNIIHVDESAGLMLGVPAAQLMHKSFARIAGLPTSTTLDDLLGIKGAAKKGAMKSLQLSTPACSTYHSMPHTGEAKVITTQHMCDQQPLALGMQAMCFEQGGKVRTLVRLQLHEPSSASMPAFVQLKEDNAAGTAATAPGTSMMAPTATYRSQHAAEHDSDSVEHSDSGEDENRAAVLAASRHKNRAHLSTTVREASHLPSYHARQSAAAAQRDGECVVYVSPSRGRHSDTDSEGSVRNSRTHNYKHSTGSAAYRGSVDDEERDAEDQAVEPPACYSNAGDATGALDPAEPGHADGQSDVGSEGISSASGTGHDEDLSVNTRRARRMKKLNTMVLSAAAQQATTTWRWHTVALAAIILVAQVVGFVIVNQMSVGRQGNALGVANMARAMDRFQYSVLRMNFMQKCYVADFIKTWSCNDGRMKLYASKLLENVNIAHRLHHTLYFGDNGRTSLADPRLMYNWTYLPRAETLFLPKTGQGDNVFVNGSRTLWEMGNVFVSAAKDVQQTGYSGNPRAMNLSTSWQYAMNNGATSLSDGYAWSLDTYVDYAVNNLLTLASKIVTLLVIEAVIIQLVCMVYEFYLLQRCNVSHLRMFSVFLALPSATVRLMAQRQLQVDDESKNEMDDDDMEMPDADGSAAVTAADLEDADAATGNNADKKQKSVRLAAGLGDDASTKSARPRKSVGKSEKKEKAKVGCTKAGSKKQRALGDQLYKALFSWMDPKFKRNGKKLQGTSAVVWRFMTLFLVWLGAIAGIYAASYVSVHGVLSPLMSLDMAAHVQYRLGRCRLAANFVAYSDDPASSAHYKARLKDELAMLSRDYSVLLYGGHMDLEADVSFTTTAPAAAFANAEISDIFFKTTRCLRYDQSTCFNTDSPFYTITHKGIDPMIKAYIEMMTAFHNMPYELSLANSTEYEWVLYVIANDGYDALNKAIEMFASWSITRLELAQNLHIGGLCISLACIVLCAVVLYRPYLQRLRSNSKAVAALLSQLPAEVDVEGLVKTVVLGFVKQQDLGSMSTAVVDKQGLNNVRPWQQGPPGGPEMYGVEM